MTPNDVFADGGEMGELMRSIRWADTPLGPPSGWSQALRTTVGLLGGGSTFLEVSRQSC